MNKLPKASRQIILDRTKDELTASYNYRYLKEFCMENGFKLGWKFFHKQEEEEMCHANMLIEYLVSNDKGEDLPPLTQTKETCESIKDTIKISLGMEEELKDQYAEDIKNTFIDGDIDTSDFLRTFLCIQRESVKEFREKMKIIEQMKDEENEMEIEDKLFSEKTELVQ